MKADKIILLNLGTTSFKFKLFDFSSGEKVLASGEIENVAVTSGRYSVSIGKKQFAAECVCGNYEDAFELCLSIMQRGCVLNSIKDVDVIGYKTVHGGPLSGTQLVDEDLLKTMVDMIPFAPVHNPIYIKMMRLIKERYPDLYQAVSFETSFHRTIPEYRTVYGVPYEWKEKYGIRRYGFHGSSHEYIAGRMKQLDEKADRIISVHLGGSSSLCAINNQMSIATSMGATPQSGLFNNNRVGDFDVFCLPELVRHYGGSLDAVMDILSTKSGFLGLSGISNDLREIIKAQKDGNVQADLAIRAFADNIVGYIGMFTAYLGSLDALVFTGGIGQNSKEMRSLVCRGLGFLQIQINEDKGYEGADCKISTEKSGVRVWVVKTNEEQVIARKIRKLIQDCNS
jgi:acetate kinase